MKLQPEMLTSQISTQINEVNKLPLMMQLTANEEESKTIVYSEEQAMAPAAVSEAFSTVAVWDP